MNGSFHRYRTFRCSGKAGFERQLTAISSYSHRRLHFEAQQTSKLDTQALYPAQTMVFFRTQNDATTNQALGKMSARIAESCCRVRGPSEL